MQHPIPSGTRPEQRGTASLFALMLLLAVGGLAGVILSVSQRNSGEINASVAANRAFLAAQAGANQALANLALEKSEPLGSADAPVDDPGGRYWVEVEELDEGGVFLIRAHGAAGLAQRSIEVGARVLVGGPFFNAVFAGNSSGDPGYVMPFGGRGTQRDEVHGNVYSGGDVKLAGDAVVSGTIRAKGEVSGGDPDHHEPGRSEPIPDLAAMNYPVTADVKVRDLFAAATYKLDDAGGSAWQLPESSPAHIFRKNPSDRVTATSATAKDDFFLEDPYETVNLDAARDGTNPYRLTFSGVGGEPGPSSNRKVFYVDGNLWLHNKKTYSFQLASQGGSGLQVTFVVKGNIYFSDSLFYTDAVRDGVAFIALTDTAVADSGNIYFGDPQYGTLREMQAFMYAENNFFDTNLSASGSAEIKLFGNMTAGNQVRIQRDHTTVGRRPITTHTKLRVDFDERIANGEIDMPGIPGVTAGSGAGLVVLFWRAISPL